MEVELIKEFLRTFHLEGLVFSSIFQILFIVWWLFMVWKYIIPSVRFGKKLGEEIAALTKEIDRLINEAIRRAPPIEDPKEGVPFEIYRKDLHRMVDGEISIDEFVDIWRGRKVQKRPTAAELQAMADRTAREKAEERPMEKELKTRMGRAFLAEWEAHLGNQDPQGFAELFMLNLNEGSEESQHFHSRFVGFMKPRNWSEVLEAIRPAAKDPKPFMCGRAMWFYAEFRLRVIRKIEEYWNRFLVSKSGHRHEWVIIPPIHSGVRLKCACGEVQEGQVGNEGPSGPMGSGVVGSAGPYSLTGIQGVTGYAPTGSRGLTGLYGGSGMGHPISGGGGHDSGLIEEVRRLRQESEKGKDYFTQLNAMIGMMSASLEKAIDQKRCANSGQGVVGWRDVSEYVHGQWVRVTRPTSPAVGQIGRIYEVKPYETRVFVQSNHGDSFAVGVSFVEFEPALPKVGEWWRRLECKIHQGLDSSQVLVGPDCEWWLSKSRIEDWKCGCIEPVNFGRGNV